MKLQRSRVFIGRLGGPFFFTREIAKIELKLKKTREKERKKKRNSIATTAPYAALRKKGGGNGHRPTLRCTFMDVGSWGFYDSLRSTILVRHANVEGRNRPPSTRVLLPWFFQRVLADREGAPYHQSCALAWQSICG